MIGLNISLCLISILGGVLHGRFWLNNCRDDEAGDEMAVNADHLDVSRRTI